MHPLDYRAANALVAYGQYIVADLVAGEPGRLLPPSAQRLAGLAGGGFGHGAAGHFRGGDLGQAAVFPTFSAAGSGSLGMLVPVIGLVQVGARRVADRYTYLPQIGLLMALVWGADAAVADGAVSVPRLAWAAAGAWSWHWWLRRAAGGILARRRNPVAARHRLHDARMAGPMPTWPRSWGGGGPCVEAIEQFKIAFEIEPKRRPGS